MLLFYYGNIVETAQSGWHACYHVIAQYDLKFALFQVLTHCLHSRCALDAREESLPMQADKQEDIFVVS
jgi:hypothetical protein